MKKVAIIMGSDSDFPVVSKAVTKLKEFGVPYEVHVMSAHRTPDAAIEFSGSAKKNGFGKEDFERVKKSSLGRQIMAYNSIESVANSFCANYFSGIGAFDFVSAFSKVTNESVHKRIFEIFGDNHAVSVIKPLEK